MLSSTPSRDMTDGESSAPGELRALVRLALPLIVGQAGNQLMSVVDTIMVGHLGATSLGAVGIGNSIFFTVSLLGFGCVLGTDPLISQAIGAGEHERARRALWQGVRVAVLISLPVMALVALSPSLVWRVGVEPATADEVRRYLYARCPNALPFLLFAAQRSYLQARASTRPILVAMALANVVNFVGNALLIYGDATLLRLGLPAIGLPALGVVGSGLASSVASVLSVVVLGLAIRALPRPAGQTVHSDERQHDPELSLAILRVGFPIGLQLLAEVGAFAVASVLVGRMGAAVAAGHQVALTLASMTFTVTVGIGMATAVRVGLFVGRADQRGARLAGIVGIASSAGFMSFTALAFLLFPVQLTTLFTDDPSVILAAAPLVLIAAVFQLSDGAQAVAAGALRGAGDTLAGFWANLIGHYAVGLPLAFVLAFVFQLGAPGVWWGLSAGLTAVAAGLIGRFLVISSRPIQRV